MAEMTEPFGAFPVGEGRQMQCVGTAALEGFMTSAIAAPYPYSQREPLSVEELHLDREFLRDLMLKTMFHRGRLTCAELADELRISATATEELLQSLTYEGLATVLGAGGMNPASYLYALSQKGLDRAESTFSRNGYVGPAPVPLDEYVRYLRLQAIGGATVTRDQIASALGPLVLSEHTMMGFGRAASSRKSTLIYGASGNGKTTVARTIGGIVGGNISIPFAIEVVGQIIRLYDPSKHESVDDASRDADHNIFRARPDRRWVTIRRPVISVGGELTRHSLELVYDEKTKVYEAPLQLKANGGTLIIDDFGRQQMRAAQLLNRWIVALEGGVDHLTMHTGQTIEVPFDVLVLFSTNLAPERLADDAFLRRIRYKIEIPNPTRDEYIQIFERECARQGVPFDRAALDHLFAEWYDGHEREMRGCHPRDLVEGIVDTCAYERVPPHMNAALLDEVCAMYFLRPFSAPA